MAKTIAWVMGTAILTAAAVGVASYWKFSGTPSEQQRWTNTEDVQPQDDDRFKQLLATDTTHEWRYPSVTVYSAPYTPPRAVPPTLWDLSDNGQAHAIDFVSKGLGTSSTAWQDLIKTVGDISEPERVDPYRADRILIATVAKGLNTLPGDRLIWTRVFVQPINFEFAGYRVAATDSRSNKIATVENATSTKLSVNGTMDAALPGLPKPDLGQSVERSQKATADVSEQYENLGIDIQPNFLRIIRESPAGGDVAGNTAIQLSMITDPSRIWCEKPVQPGEPEELCQPRVASAPQKTGADDTLVLLVSSFHLAEGAEPAITVLPQNVLPHCPLRAKVWMLYESREITQGRQQYVEGMQQVSLRRSGYNPVVADLVAADDIAPAVWSIKMNDGSEKSGTATDKDLDLRAQTGSSNKRRLVFTDYVTASQVAHFIKDKLADHPGTPPKIKNLTFDISGNQTLTPFKHVADDCAPYLQTQTDAAR